MISVNIEKMNDDEIIELLVEVDSLRDRAEALLIDRRKQSADQERASTSKLNCLDSGRG